MTYLVDVLKSVHIGDVFDGGSYIGGLFSGIRWRFLVEVLKSVDIGDVCGGDLKAVDTGDVFAGRS